MAHLHEIINWADIAGGRTSCPRLRVVARAHGMHSRRADTQVRPYLFTLAVAAFGVRLTKGMTSH